MTDSKALSRERYNKYAQGYVNSVTHARGADLERLIALANPQPDWIMLDVATGGGHTALKFAPHVGKVIATDLAENMLNAAREFITAQGVTNVEFKLADAEALPFDASTFDLVSCRIAPHHFPDAAKFVREATRVLKFGGLLIVQDHVLPEDDKAAAVVDGFEKLRDPSHNHAFTLSGWAGMFEDAGLSIIATEQVVKRHHFMTWAERQGCTAETVQALIDMHDNAPQTTKDWMDAQDWHTSDATFVNHHLIIIGRK